MAQALGADKVDVFLAEPDQQQLRAYGVSQTPMGLKEIEKGLDCLPLAHSGWIGEVYRTGHFYHSSHAQKDSQILPGFTEELQVQSLISVPLVTPEARQISNWGDPLPTGQRSTLFQPFAKGPHSHGFGLGLYIAQRIAQAHHGTLTAQVEVEGLTRFTLALPCDAMALSPS